jgi:SAM-dependent methyltransferase
MQTAERSSVLDPSEHVIYNRCLFAYKVSQPVVHGAVIELGSGEGYGISLLAPSAQKYLAIDKFEPVLPAEGNIEFRKVLLPSLTGIPDNTYDVAVSFQVIEHIKNDKAFVSEIHRVLKKGGKLIVTTPNRLMSLSRNPWHIREYTGKELETLLFGKFETVTLKGVYGNEKVMDYYLRNKESVRKIMKYDVLDLQHLLPRKILQVPYDIMNRLNRRRLLKNNDQLVSDVTVDDFRLDDYDDQAFDIYAVAVK